MEIKLSNIKHYERMSEETNCFDAFVLINGVKCAYAKNDGQGGETFINAIYNPKSKEETERNRQLIIEAEAYCKTLPPYTFEIEGEVISTPNDLNTVVDDLLEKYIVEKIHKKFAAKIAKDCLTGICFGTDTSYRMLKFKQPVAFYLGSERGREFIKTTIKQAQAKLQGGERILNTNLPDTFIK